MSDRASGPSSTAAARAADAGGRAGDRSVLAVLGRGVVDPATPVARADDPGLTRGDGCFEGCRLLAGEVVKLDAHLARMARSAAALGIGFEPEQWRDLVRTAAAVWDGADEAAVKLLLTRGAAASGPLGLCTISPLSADYERLRRVGLTVITLTRGFDSAAFAGAGWLLGGVKTLSYAVNMAAVREAERRGADDALFVSTDGRVLESTTGTVVWASSGSGRRTLHTTPTGSTGILPGTTQQVLFERAASAGWETAQTLATLTELRAADVVWLVSSVRGPIDVVTLDGTPRIRRPEVDAEVRRLAGF